MRINGLHPDWCENNDAARLINMQSMYGATALHFAKTKAIADALSAPSPTHALYLSLNPLTGAWCCSIEVGAVLDTLDQGGKTAAQRQTAAKHADIAGCIKVAQNDLDAAAAVIKQAEIDVAACAEVAAMAKTAAKEACLCCTTAWCGSRHSNQIWVSGGSCESVEAAVKAKSSDADAAAALQAVEAMREAAAAADAAAAKAAEAKNECVSSHRTHLHRPNQRRRLLNDTVAVLKWRALFLSRESSCARSRSSGRMCPSG